MTPRMPEGEIFASNAKWSARILALAMGGILSLTLYPFRFAVPVGTSRWALPFLLQSGMKRVGPLDDFLNVLLFVPFGFGLAGILRHRAKPRSHVILLALGAGLACSYTIEFLQFYVPNRDSGWHDVMTNSCGALVGSLLFEGVGWSCLKVVAQTENMLAGMLTWRRAIWLICAYYAVWLIISVPLQEWSRLSNWDANCPLIVGNLALGRTAVAWKGDIYRLEFWDKALPEDEAKGITSGQPSAITGTASIAAYDFTGIAPYKDLEGKLPDLTWSAGKGETIAPPMEDANGPVTLDGRSWLSTKAAAAAFVNACKGTNQFSVLVICRAAEPMEEDKRIFSISRPNGIADLDFGQNRGDLVFWFRNPISIRRTPLLWIDSGLFVSKKEHTILFTYNGAELSLFVDGQRDVHEYVLGPGTVLTRLIRRVKPAELEACRYAYYGLVFFPAGILLGITARNNRGRTMGLLLARVALILVPAGALELLLVHVSGRGMTPSGVLLSMAFGIAGMCWINLGSGHIQSLNKRDSQAI
jgi:VanZ like family